MDYKTDKNRKAYGSSVEDDRILLEKLAKDGLLTRYGKKNKVAAERLARELQIINDLGFNSYFLINYDIIRYAQSRGFYYVGRGSGTNSIVAYCLRITDVDPIELNLYFERFLNPHRTSPPDFDIDFSWTDRDEVIDYIFKRYGKNYVALLGAYPTFQHDAIIRQLGKVLGLPDEEIKALQRTTAPQDKIGKPHSPIRKVNAEFPKSSFYSCLRDADLRRTYFKLCFAVHATKRFSDSANGYVCRRRYWYKQVRHTKSAGTWTYKGSVTTD